MALKRFVKASGTGDRLPTGDYLNVPIWVKPLEKFSGLVTEHDPEGTEVNLRAHAYILNDKDARARVVFFNGAVVDGLGQYIGEEVVVRFADMKKKTGKGTYRGVQDGTDEDYKLAESMLDEIHAAIAAREAELDSEEGLVNDAPAQNEDQAAKVRGAFKR